MVQQRQYGFSSLKLNLCSFYRIRQKNVLFASSLVVALLWLVICHISRQPGPHALVGVLLCASGMLFCTLAALAHAHKNCEKIPLTWIFATAVALRLLSMTGEPLFEDDFYRYLWDGYQTATTGNPYSKPPSDYFDVDVPVEFEEILSLINYPEIATVYGPVTEWIFALAYWIQSADVRPLQLLAGFADLLIMLLLWRLGAGNALLLYAWSPLLLKEFSLTAHPDVFAILFVFMSIYLLSRRMLFFAGTCLGLAFACKVFAILVLPFLVSGIRRDSWSDWFKQVAIAGAGFLLTLSAVTFWYGTFTIWVPEGLCAMADSWLFNAPVYLILLNVFQFQSIKLILLGLFAGYLLLVFVRRLTRSADRCSADPETGGSTDWWVQSAAAFRGDWVFMLFLLSLPVINPWYVAWILPFATLFPRWWSWTASAVVLMSYWYGSYVAATGATALQLPLPVIVVEYSLAITIPFIAWTISRSARQRTNC